MNARVVIASFLVTTDKVADFEEALEENLQYLDLPAHVFLQFDDKTPSAKYLAKANSVEVQEILGGK